MKSILAAFLLLVTLFSSCTKVIDIDLPKHDSKLVVNSLFCSNIRLPINIGSSTSIMDNTGSSGIYNSIIDLYEDGILVQSGTISDSIFFASGTVKENSIYRFELSAPGYPNVTATDTVPIRTRINALEHNKSVWVNENGLMYSQVKIEFTDSPANRNFYELKLYVFIDSPWEEDTKMYDFVGIGGIPDPVLKDSWPYFYETRSLPFKDNLFNGTECNLDILYRIPNNNDEPYDLIIELNSISRNYYNYKKQLGIYMKTLDSDIFLGAPDPVKLYSNIENGYGIFAAYSSDKVILNISK